MVKGDLFLSRVRRESARRSDRSRFSAQAQAGQARQDFGAEIGQLVEVVDERHRDPGETGGGELRHLVRHRIGIADQRQPAHAVGLVTAQALELLHLSKRQIPLIFVGRILQRETVAEFITRGAYDCIEMGHIGHLPVAVHRALDEKTLREERDRAQIGLRHSEARYRALAGNLSYGICRCDLDGKFLEVNEAIVKMLGYDSKEELLGVNLASELIQDPARRAQLLGHQPRKVQPTPSK